MGSFANSLFKIMLGWLQTAVSAVWSAFTSENGSSVFNWIGKHWILLAGILCAVGLVTDLCVYIFRWKPYKVWKSFFSKTTGQNDQLYNGTPELSGHMESKSPDRGQISGYAKLLYNPGPSTLNYKDGWAKPMISQLCCTFDYPGSF